MDFTSDNASGAAPAILEAMVAANHGTAAGYGMDIPSRRAVEQLRNLFECEDLTAFFVSTGTAANALALGALVPGHGAVLCHEDSHIQMDECGAPEFFTHGAKLVPLSGALGKLAPGTVRDALDYLPQGSVHLVQPKVLSITQATEWGTLYGADEIRALSEVCRDRGMRLHMDGARFANAMAALDMPPAEVTWRAGVDVLTFGATKNGAVAAEAVIFFEPGLAGEFVFRRKRSGHLLSKSRFIGAQWDAYLSGGLWLELAGHANAMARRLAETLEMSPGVSLAWPVEANEIFALLPPGASTALRDAGARFYPWTYPGSRSRLAHEDRELVRMVTSFATAKADVDRFAVAAKSVFGR